LPKPAIFTRQFWLGNDWDGWGGQGPASGASVLMTSYGQPGSEPILPALMSNTAGAYGGNAVVFGAILARLMLFSEATFAFRDVTDKHLFGGYETDGRSATTTTRRRRARMRGRRSCSTSTRSRTGRRSLTRGRISGACRG
jgi:hypothetical protein